MVDLNNQEDLVDVSETLYTYFFDVTKVLVFW